MAQKHEFIETIHRKRIELFIKQIPKAERILDLGCAGYPLCIDYKENSKIIGINRPCGQFSKVIKAGYPELFISGDATMLPFKNNSFDVVFAGELIEHIENPNLMLIETNRVLRKDGLLFLDTPNFNVTEIMEKIVRKNRPDFKHGMEEGHIKEFRFEELKEMLINNDFKVLGSKGVYLPLDTLLFKKEWVGNLWNYSIYRQITLKMGEYLPKYAYLVGLVAKKN
jgi:ubiquinone/menaquinone biosynthesis C-methylase UbiE